MSKTIYCTGKIKDKKSELKINCSNADEEKLITSKRVNIVSIKMIKESSILYKYRKISSPDDAFELIKTFLEDSDREQLIVCCLDTKNQPTAIQIVSIGSLNSSIVHPREVFKIAILSNAASIILFHNHPSGDVSPSNEDVNITSRLKECGKIIGIELLDHIIVGYNSFLSIKERNLI